MRTSLAAAALALHGLIHLIGFVVPFGIAQVEGFAYRTTVLAGALEIGDGGARLVGVVWLVLAIGFLAAGVATWRRARLAPALAALLAVGSAAVCALGLPDAVFGIVVNAAILAVVAWRRLPARTGTPAAARR